MQQGHAEPNYIAVFIWLAALTAVEVIAVYMPLTRLALAAILVVLAFTKAALVALSHSAHAELSRDGIQVTALLPGFVETPGASWAQEPSGAVMMPAEDIAEAVRFLLRTSPRSFVPELVMTTAGPGILHSPVDWEATT